MALFKMDSLDDYFEQREQLRDEGACAYGWIVPDVDGYGVGVLCVKKDGHLGPHRAWGGHTLETGL